jgi:AraC family transcriptional regulator, regulatory protein of adaptative response / methylated-DNA-[protein]-cysteine methyltransferase
MNKDYQIVEKAIGYIRENYLDQPDLEEIAGVAGMSTFHFQRVFSRWAGISPKKFLQYITIEHAKQVLMEGQESVLNTAYDVGLSSGSRLYDLFVNFEAITPGEYKSLGRDISILYSFFTGPFGDYLLGATERGICALRFLDTGEEERTLEELRAEWPLSHFIHEHKKISSFASRIFNSGVNSQAPLSLHIKGTNFQVKVWEALLNISIGNLSTYGNVAREIGQPSATRAVGSAVGKNPVSYIIPCHRVIRSSGVFGNYRWGADRKLSMIGYEAAKVS